MAFAAVLSTLPKMRVIASLTGLPAAGPLQESFLQLQEAVRLLGERKFEGTGLEKTRAPKISQCVFCLVQRHFSNGPRKIEFPIERPPLQSNIGDPQSFFEITFLIGKNGEMFCTRDAYRPRKKFVTARRNNPGNADGDQHQPREAK